MPTAKTLATIFLAFGIVLAGLQWWQIVYRVRIFYQDYGGVKYANHIGDGLFTIIHIVNILGLLTGAFSIGAFWRESGMRRWWAGCVTAANAIAWLTFSYLHATGMLVGYTEAIMRAKGM